jgi:hypothetical protein
VRCKTILVLHFYVLDKAINKYELKMILEESLHCTVHWKLNKEVTLTGKLVVAVGPQYFRAAKS